MWCIGGQGGRSWRGMAPLCLEYEMPPTSDLQVFVTRALNLASSCRYVYYCALQRWAGILRTTVWKKYMLQNGRFWGGGRMDLRGADSASRGTALLWWMMRRKFPPETLLWQPRRQMNSCRAWQDVQAICASQHAVEHFRRWDCTFSSKSILHSAVTGRITTLCGHTIEYYVLVLFFLFIIISIWATSSVSKQ